MSNMVEIGPSNFDRDLSESKNISRRPVDRVRRWLTAAVAGAVLTTGAGIARDVRAEAPNPIVDDPTKIEASSEGIETPESVLESQGISNPDSPATEEGQVTAKGVGDLLANADEGVVTNFKAGVEVPDNDRGEVHYGTKVTNESGEAVVVPLEGSGNSEVEKKLTPEVVKNMENMMSYLNIGNIHTDAIIKSRLMTWPTEKTDDLGLIHTRDVQGRLLGYLKSSDGRNMLLILGLKDVSGERMITLARLPLFMMVNKSIPFRFLTAEWSSPDLSEGDCKPGETRDELVVAGILENQRNRNVVVQLYTDKITSDIVDSAKSYNDDSVMEYIDELKKNSFLSRTLDASVYRNGVKKLEYSNPKLPLLKLTKNASRDDIYSFIDTATNTDIKDKVPIAFSLAYLK